MKRTLLLTILSLFITVSMTAQSRTSAVKGIVVDESGEPLAGALVMADGTKNALTDGQGAFTLTGVSRTNVAFEVSYLGYETYKQTFLVGGANFSIGTVRMKPAATRIDDVSVTATAAMASQKGDTVQYTAAAFKVNPDADASDLVSKMPGVSIEDGAISSQGEAVSRVYVDGKLLFGDAAMDALANLPADLIESVQVFDERTEESRFSGFDDGQRQRAMNVVTKHKSKRTTTAELNGGYGNPIKDNGDFNDRFRVRGTINSFSETNRISVFGNTGNITERAWQANRSGLFTSRNAGVGLYNNWNDKLEITMNYRYRNDQDVIDRRTVQDWFATDDFTSRIFEETRYNSELDKNHSANLRLEWKPNAKNRLLWRPNLSFNDENILETATASNTVDGMVESISNNNTNASNDSFSTGGSLLYTHVFSKPGRTINTDINYGLSKNSSLGRLIDDSPESTERQNFLQDGNVWNKRMTARLSYGEPVDSMQRFEFSYSFRIEDAKSDRYVYDYLDDPNGILDPTLTNRFTRNYFANTGGIGYSFNHPKTKITAGINFRNTRLFKDQTFPGVEKQGRSFNTWEPRAQLRRDITNTKNLIVNYNSNTNVPAIEQFQKVIRTNNMIMLTAGNPDLKPSVSHNLSVRYQSSNTENLSTMQLFASVRMERNRIGNRTQYYNQETILTDYYDFVAQQGSQLTTPVNINGYLSGRMHAGYSFPLTKLGLKVNTGLSYDFSRVPSYVGSELNYANSNGAGLMLGFESNISENVDFSIRSNTRYGYTDNSSSKVNSNYLNENIMARANFIFLGGFVFNTDLSYNYQRNESKNTFTQDFFMWNAGFGRKFLRKKNAEIRITVYDILKQNQNLRHFVGDQYIQDQWSNIIGRYAMLTFSYKFNSLNSLSSRSATAKAAADSFDRSGDNRRPGPGGPPPGGGRPF